MNFIKIENEIREIVNREIEAWNQKNVEKLLSIFHHDMVWVWPKTPKDHNPINWIMGMGRYEHERWQKSYDELFKTHNLIHNIHSIQKIVVSNEGDGAFAVVDVDTLWQNIKTMKDFHWKGRACKIYTKMNDGQWKMVAHTGLLDYGQYTS